MRSVALAMLEAGQREDAIALARSLTVPGTRDSTFGMLAAELARARRPSDALALVRDIAGPAERGRALTDIALALPE
jgi:hypothetical protein